VYDVIFILEVLFIAFISYAIIPTLLYRLFSTKSIQDKQNQNAVYLTFDDGPNPLYTPQLLDLLKQYNAKGTFFVLGERAKQYPDLILRMKEEGHTIGIHNNKHTSNWITDPFTFQYQLNMAAANVEKITGDKPIYYRPPWGHFNLFSWSASKSFKNIMWEYAPRDWNVMDRNKLTQRLLDNLHEGSIILLHDCGETLGADNLAPGNMIEALKEMFEMTEDKGFLFRALEKKPADSTENLVNRSTTSF
jgi:peptidoglycan/xylan/chitin deacetylase (PgdA/CDA1 family)